MSTGQRIAFWTIGVLGALLAASQFLLVGLNWSHPDAAAYYWRPAALAQGVLALVFIAIGLFVAGRRPDNRVGWLVALIGLTLMGYQAVTEYAVYTLIVAAASLPGGPEAGILSQVSWSIPFALVPVLLLIYPTGRFLSNRWKVGAWLAGISTVVLLSGTILLWPLRPLGRDLLFLDDLEIRVPGDSQALVGILMLVSAVLFAVVSAFVRFSRGDRIERLQMKWLLVAGIMLSVQGILATTGIGDTGPGAAIAEVFLLLTLLSLPFAVAVAVLRYRLYEIDKILSRTVTYGLVTALLVAVYLGSVFVLRSLLPVQGELAVAGSTLATAALFNPVRRRVQKLVDRRFNRSRYNAEQTLAAFTGRLRDQVDLNALTNEVRALAEQTVQPVSVSVWWRPQS